MGSLADFDMNYL